MIFFYVLQMRWGWYLHRRQLGFPISLWRAFTSPYPRFSSFEEHEAGCPKHALRDYSIVKEDQNNS